MGWEQGVRRERVVHFLQRFLDIDPDKLLHEAFEKKLSELGLSYKISVDYSREEGDANDPFHPNKVEFSDGRMFVETLTRVERGDDWSNEQFSFVETGEPYTRELAEWDTPAEAIQTRTELVPGDAEESVSLEAMREQGNSASPGMGDEIVAFFTSQGITGFNFEKGD